MGIPKGRSVDLQQIDVTLYRRDNAALPSARYLAEVLGDRLAFPPVLRRTSMRR